MKKSILFAMTLVILSPIAQAKTKHLTEGSAAAFVWKHFPDASLPGPVTGVFTYVNKYGEKKHGYADCFFPAMGARSAGFVSTCEVIY